MKEWVQQVSRHFTTIMIILGAFWWLAVPRAEEFIREAVNDRITLVEKQLIAVQEQLVIISNKLGKLESDANQR